MLALVITGITTIDSLLTDRFEAFFDVLRHLVLPALALSFGSMVQNARLARMGW